MKNIPNKIYLQVGEDTTKEDDFNDLEVSWCDDKIHDTDIEYVLYERLRKQIEARDEYIKEIEGRLLDDGYAKFAITTLKEAITQADKEAK